MILIKVISGGAGLKPSLRVQANNKAYKGNRTMACDLDTVCFSLKSIKEWAEDPNTMPETRAHFQDVMKNCDEASTTGPNGGAQRGQGILAPQLR